MFNLIVLSFASAELMGWAEKMALLNQLYSTLEERNPGHAYEEAVDMVWATAVALEVPFDFPCLDVDSTDEEAEGADELPLPGDFGDQTIPEILSALREGTDSHFERQLIVETAAGLLGIGCDEENERRRTHFSFCFSEDSTVWVQTPGGMEARRMENVEPLDMVLSRSADTAELYFDRVYINLHRSQYSSDAERTAEILRIEFEGGFLDVTPNHLLPSGDDLKAAEKFSVGTQILTGSGLRVVTGVSTFEGKISSLMTSNSEYLVGGPGVSNHSIAAVGSNYNTLWVSRVPQRILAEFGILEAWFLHMRSLTRHRDWHPHEFLADRMLVAMPTNLPGAIVVTAVFLAAGIASWILLLVAANPLAVSVAGVACLVARRKQTVY